MSSTELASTTTAGWETMLPNQLVTVLVAMEPFPNPRASDQRSGEHARPTRSWERFYKDRRIQRSDFPCGLVPRVACREVDGFRSLRSPISLRKKMLRDRG